MALAHGIAIKKKFGQHFLRDRGIVQRMCARAELTDQSSVFEIGSGDGFLTREILNHPVARLWSFEIDPAWAQFVRNSIKDPRLTIYQEDFLHADLTRLEPNKPWVLLANLPYQITFAILHRLQEYRHLISHGIIMAQEEVAQKIVKKGGRGFGYPSLFFQHYFDWQLLEKISPAAFVPPPQVYSRLLYFVTRQNVPPIPDEKEFWQFIKLCFKQPRRTLKNNLMQTHYASAPISEETLQLRSQQMGMKDFLQLWDLIRAHSSKI